MMLSVFFFNDTATTEIYTLSLHDALPIYRRGGPHGRSRVLVVLAGVRAGRARALARRVNRPHLLEQLAGPGVDDHDAPLEQDRKSTRLNSSHANISYAVFCLKKKKTSLFE